MPPDSPPTPLLRATHDAQLIERIRHSDGQALGLLLRAYFAWLVDVVTPIVASRDLAQDVVQDVFMRLWDIRTSLDIRGSVAGYLYRAVRNRARNTVAHEHAQRNLQQRIRDAYGDTELYATNTGETNLLDREFRTALDQAIQKLSPRTRDIFLMRVEAEMSYAEIASTFGIGVPTVHVQMSKAMKSVAKTMARWVDPEDRFGLRDKSGTSSSENF